MRQCVDLTDRGKMINALSVDLEHWWCNEFLRDYLPEKSESCLTESLQLLLDVLNNYNTRATFFVLGTVAEEFPDSVETIYSEGHEVASHGYSHTLLAELGRERFDAEMKHCVKQLHHIVHETPRGFRSPCFSLTNDTRWALEVLEKHGFTFDSSIYPISARLYGVPHAPLEPYYPSREDVAIEDANQNGRVIEFPLTAVKVFGQNIPISGGFYLRVLPFSFVQWGLRKVNETRPAMIYVHPWEMNSNIPRVNAPMLSRFEAYHGIGSNLKKLKALVREFHFAPIGEVLDEI